MVCILLKALRKQAKRGNVDVEKVGISYSISMHRETIVADYKRIAAMLADSKDGEGWFAKGWAAVGVRQSKM